MDDKSNMLGCRLVNTSKASEMLGVSRKTLRRWCHYGLLSYYNTAGGHKRFLVSELLEFMEKNYVKANP